MEFRLHHTPVYPTDTPSPVKKMIFRISSWFLPVAIVVSLVSQTTVAQPSASFPNSDPRGAILDYVPGQILVRLRDDVDTAPSKTGRTLGIAALDDILENAGVEKISRLFPEAPSPDPSKQPQLLRSYSGHEFERPSLHNIYRIELRDSDRQRDVLDAFGNHPDVLYAEPNYRYHMSDFEPAGPVISPENDPTHSPLPTDHRQLTTDHSQFGETFAPPIDDPQYGSQWHIPATNIDDVWDTETGDASQIIAILDTGVDWEHADLDDKIWENTTEATGFEGVDDDGNGFVDDIRGWDFINADNDPRDDNSHGTHVAGIAAAETNNGIGIAGVNWGAQILPVKVLQSSGSGDAATIAQAITYAADAGATVINMSFGSYAESQTMKAALESAYATASLVAAAGNDALCIGPGRCPYPVRLGMPFFPAAYSFVLGAEATADTDVRASFSNYDQDGPTFSSYSDLLSYELPSPGDGILSTIPGGLYQEFSGTSMAAPVLSGAVALYKTSNPGDSEEIMWGNLIYSASNHFDLLAALSSSPTPSLQFITHTVVDTLAGDEDGRVDAGETIELWFEVRNTWGQADDVNLMLSLDALEDPLVATITDGSSSIGSLSSYARGTNETDPFEIQIAGSVADNRDIKFEALVYDGDPGGAIAQEVVLTVQSGEELGGLLASNRTLTPDKLYIVSDNLAIDDGVTLTIKPGTRIEIADGKSIAILGELVAHGKPDPDSMITFTANGPSGWESIRVESTGNASCEFCIVENGGSSNRLFSVHPNVSSSIPIFKHSIIRNNTTFELWENRWKVTAFEQSNIIHNTGHRMLLSPVLKNNNIMFNTSTSSSLSAVPALTTNNENHFYYNNVFGNLSASGKEINMRQDGTFGVYDLHPNYWGTADSLQVGSTIIDFYEDGSLPIADYEGFLKAPSDTAHGIVWKIHVNGFDAQDEAHLLDPLGTGQHQVDVYFNREMDIEYTPQVSFGVREPWTQHFVAENDSWSADSTIWTATFDVELHTGDGINRLRVAGARDTMGFEIPIEQRRFEFVIDAAGAASTGFTATAGMGKVDLDWVEPSDISDLLGYNLYRFGIDPVTTYTDTVAINEELLLDHAFTDFEVIPDSNYYYMYTVLRTDFSESDLSDVSHAVPLTSALGDANGDLGVDVLDVNALVAYILGQTPQPFIFEAADLNDDGTIDVLDIVATINLILSSGKRAPMLASVHEDVQATLQLVEGLLTLDSPEQLAALQITVSGLEADALQRLSGLGGMEFGIGTDSDGHTVLLAYSLTGAFIDQGLSELVSFEIPEARIVSAVLADGSGYAMPARILNGEEPVIPDAFILKANYPNPFNARTTIEYGLTREVSEASILVYDVLGRTVVQLREGVRQAGYHTVNWDGRDGAGRPLASGVYYYQLRIQEQGDWQIVDTAQMVMIK